MKKFLFVLALSSLFTMSSLQVFGQNINRDLDIINSSLNYTLNNGGNPFVRNYNDIMSYNKSVDNENKNKEISIDDYDINSAKKVFFLKEGFLEDLANNKLSIDENSYLWYI